MAIRPEFHKGSLDATLHVLRRALGLAPPNPEEADRQMAEEEIERIVNFATKPPEAAPPQSPGSSPPAP
jgi:hypothetical protein